MKLVGERNFVRTINYLLLALLIPYTAYAAGPALVVPEGERQLFLDDVDIADMQNLTRTMHRPDKKGAVIRPRCLATGEQRPDPHGSDLASREEALGAVGLRRLAE